MAKKKKRKKTGDEEFRLWWPAFVKAHEGEKPTCPYCGSDDMEVIAKAWEDNIGYVIISCNKCKKFGNSCRQLMENYKGEIERI